MVFLREISILKYTFLICWILSVKMYEESQFFRNISWHPAKKKDHYLFRVVDIFLDLRIFRHDAWVSTNQQDVLYPVPGKQNLTRHLRMTINLKPFNEWLLTPGSYRVP